MRDQAFFAIQYVYKGWSGRRTDNARERAAEKGLVSRVPFFDVVSKFLCRSESTPILADLLARSSFPFRAIEDSCAADSSGFRTTTFHNYRRERYDQGRLNEWLKLHVLVGLRTHAIIAAHVTEGSAHDAPQLPILLERALEAGFELEEVLADKAYNSRKIFALAKAAGLVVYSPFKKNQTGQSKGSPEYHRMYNLFAYHREEFDEHYRHRVQVEAAFGAMKKAIGETISSRNFDAQVNELLCKAIVHNLRMLVQAMFAVGAVAEFLERKVAPDSENRVSEGLELLNELSSKPDEAGAPVVLSDPSE